MTLEDKKLSYCRDNAWYGCTSPQLKSIL